jgi:hypothetical protein
MLLYISSSLHDFLLFLTSVWTSFFVGYERRKQQVEDIPDQAFPFRTEWVAVVVSRQEELKRIEHRFISMYVGPVLLS